MSKNISIQEGGLGKQFTTEKLKTNLVGGGTCLWVPEDEVQLGTKTITKNGTYKASGDGYYGYSEVNVNITNVGSASGKDPDGSGDDAVATTDPGTGEIVITKVPSRIEVVTPPTNPYGIYTNGQTIGTEGMVVKAYLASGGEYGAVPIGEITLNPTTAVYDESTDTPSPGESTYGGQTILWCSPSAVFHRFGKNEKEQEANDYGYPSVSGASTVYGVTHGRADAGMTQKLFSSADFSGTYRGYNGKQIEITTQKMSTFFVASIGGSYNNDLYKNLSYYPPASGGELREPQIFEVLANGETTDPGRAGSHQSITVSWPRPGDGKVLETTFEILVAPPYNDGSEG